MPNALDYILESCVSALQGSESIEQCLERYPHLAQDLRPLLETAQALMALERLEVSERARAAQKMRLQALILERKLPKDRPRFRLWPIPALRPLVAVLASLAVFVAGGVIMAQASQDSVPGDTLYSVKRATESLRLAVASPESKVHLHTEFADRRMQEMVHLAGQGKVDQLEPLTQQVRRSMNIAGSLAQLYQGNRLALRRQVEESYQQRGDQLRALLGSAPESARAAIQRALLITDARYKQTLAELSN